MERRSIQKLVDAIYGDGILHHRAIYGAEYLLPFMGSNKLKLLENLFARLNNQVAAHSFIEICAQFLHFPRNEKYEFIHGLLQFFKNIDMDGNGTLSWSEFTQFLIDSFEHDDNSILTELTSTNLQSNQILNKVHNFQDKHYVPSSVIIDRIVHGNFIEKVQADNKKRIHMLQHKSNCIKVIEKEKPDKLKTIVVTPDKVYIQTFCYSSIEGKHCLISSDQTFYFVNMSLQSHIICSFYYDLIQNKVWYSEQAQAWITTGFDGRIRLWKFKKYTQQEVDENIGFQTMKATQEASSKRVLQGHTDIVTCVVEMKQPKCLASCSKDGRIILWDINTAAPICELRYKEQTARALKGLDYSEHFNHSLLSYGFEPQVRVWCPQLSYSRAYLRSLQGHFNSPIVAKFIQPTRYCLTVDQRNCVRIWDIKFYTLIQFITCEPATINDLCFVDEQMFVIATKKLLYYDNMMNKKAKRMLDQEAYPCDVMYSDFFDILVVFTKIDTRFYDGRTGCVKMVLNNIHHQTKCRQLAGKSKKLFVIPDARIEQYHLNHFKKIEPAPDSPYEKYDMQQKFLNDTVLVLLDEYNILIVGDSQSRITYHHFNIDTKLQIKTLTGGHRSSPIISMVTHNNRLYSCSKNGVVSVWQLNTGAYLNHFQFQNENIEQLSFPFSGNFLVIKTLEGLWLVGTKCLKIHGAQCLDTHGGRVYASDCKGQIHIYCQIELLQLIGNEDYGQEQIDKKMFFRREQFDCSNKVLSKRKKQEVKGLRLVTTIAAHKEEITCLKIIPNQGGLLSASLDKTIRIWNCSNDTLFLQSHLNIVNDIETRWTFPKSLICKEIEHINSTLSFIQQYENTKIEDKEKFEITELILKKIFYKEDVEPVLVPLSTTQAKNDYRRFRSSLFQMNTVNQELEQINKEIERSCKLRDIRQKVQRLTKPKNQELGAQERSRNDIRNSSYQLDNQKTDQTKKYEVKTAKKRLLINSEVQKIESNENVDKNRLKPEALMDNFLKNNIAEQRSAKTSVMMSRPTTSSSNKNLIKDVKCRVSSKDVRDWKKYVKYDQQTKKWTALKK